MCGLDRSSGWSPVTVVHRWWQHCPCTVSNDAPPSHRVTALGGLHLQDLSTVIGEQLTGEGASEEAAQLQDAYSRSTLPRPRSGGRRVSERCRRPCAVDPEGSTMSVRCRRDAAGDVAARSGTFAADGHGAPSARSPSPMSATSSASRPRRLAVARARCRRQPRTSRRARGGLERDAAAGMTSAASPPLRGRFATVDEAMDAAADQFGDREAYVDGDAAMHVRRVDRGGEQRRRRPRGRGRAPGRRRRHHVATVARLRHRLRRGRPGRCSGARASTRGSVREVEAIVERSQPAVVISEPPVGDARSGLGERRPRRSPADPAVIIWTSGTTGLPEGRVVRPRTSGRGHNRWRHGGAIRPPARCHAVRARRATWPSSGSSSRGGSPS